MQLAAKSLAVDTLEQIRGRLADAAALQRDAAALLQQDQAQAGYEKMGESIGAWLQVQQAVLHAPMLLGINLDEVQVDVNQSKHVSVGKSSVGILLQIPGGRDRPLQKGA